MPYGISFVNVMTIDTRATDNPDYIGKEWRGLSGYTEQAYLQWDSKYSRLTFGRSYMINGPGRKGSLLFSQFCRPVDHLRLEFFLKRFSFQSLMGKLDTIDGARRFISSHRFGFQFGKMSVAFSEAVL